MTGGTMTPDSHNRSRRPSHASRLSLRNTSRVAFSVAVAATALGAASVAAASADQDAGLFGTQDPTYDGVYRQSLSLLALHAAGATPAPAAVDWLLDQQCATGEWTSYRADVTADCAPGTADSNATALAVQALAALGETPRYDAISWFASAQNADGGFSYNPGGASDANSTGLVLGALTAAGVDPATVTAGGNTGFTALAALQLGCEADAAHQGAYDYSAVDFAGTPKPALEVNDFATAQAVPGALAAPILTPSQPSPVAALPTCPDGAASDAERAVWGATYLAQTMEANPDGPFLVSAFAPGPDYGTTSSAVLALAAAGVAPATAEAAASWLATNSSDWLTDDTGADLPASLAGLTLATTVTGGDATDLVTRLAATGPQAVDAPADPEPPADTEQPTLPDTGANDRLAPAAGMLVLTGAGLLAAAAWGRRREPAPQTRDAAGRR